MVSITLKADGKITERFGSDSTYSGPLTATIFAVANSIIEPR